MGAPLPGMQAADDSTAEALLSSLKTIAAAERRKHATVFNYWLSIRGDRQFPPIRDLDPLEISDAGPFSILLEMIGGGEDADIRHLGQAIKMDVQAEKIGDAPNPSLLSCIANKLPIVAASRQAFAFEDEFKTPDGTTRCWVTLLPFSATGTWIDYVYGFVSLDPPPNTEETAETEVVAEEQPAAVEAEAGAEVEIEAEVEAEAEAIDATVVEAEPEELEEIAGEIESPAEADVVDEADSEGKKPALSGRPGFSAKLFESLASVGGFYGRVVDVDQKSAANNEEVEPIEASVGEAEIPLEEDTREELAEGATEEIVEGESEVADAEAETAGPVAEEEHSVSYVEELPETTASKNSKKPNRPVEGDLQTKLTEVRAKADEARMAKLRANAALYEGLSAAYDFALDAEENAEDYLKLVEAQGLKIQLRSPMKPVVKLAFDGMCDDSTITQLEAVLAWALKNDLPRGSLAERIETEGGLGSILAQARAA